MKSAEDWRIKKRLEVGREMEREKSDLKSAEDWRKKRLEVGREMEWEKSDLKSSKVWRIKKRLEVGREMERENLRITVGEEMEKKSDLKPLSCWPRGFICIND